MKPVFKFFLFPYYWSYISVTHILHNFGKSRTIFEFRWLNRNRRRGEEEKKTNVCFFFSKFESRFKFCIYAVRCLDRLKWLKYKHAANTYRLEWKWNGKFVFFRDSLLLCVFVYYIYMAWVQRNCWNVWYSLFIQFFKLNFFKYFCGCFVCYLLVERFLSFVLVECILLFRSQAHTDIHITLFLR